MWMCDFLLHYGPAHPAAHGVLRAVIWMSGEFVVGVCVTVGLLHRGTELMVEWRHVIHVVGYMDRLDYVCMVGMEHVFVLAVECAVGVTVSLSVGVARCIIHEVNRMLNHMLNIACHAGDLGCLLCLLWLFEDREMLFLLLSECGGSRMHSALMVPGTVRCGLPASVLRDVIDLVTAISCHFDVVSGTVVNHRCLYVRTGTVGVVSSGTTLGLSGVMHRGSGCC